MALCRATKLTDAYKVWERGLCKWCSCWLGGLLLSIRCQSWAKTNILGRGLRIKLRGIVRVLYGSLVAMSDDSVANSKKEKDSLLL